MVFVPATDWIDAPNPAAPPFNARKITAADLLRYEYALQHSMMYHIQDIGTGDDTAAVQAQVNAAPAGAMLFLPSHITTQLSDYVNLTKPVTIVGGNVNTGTNNRGFNISSGDVELHSVSITGEGSSGTYTAGNNLINAVGTDVAPLLRCRFLNCTLTDTAGEGMRLTWLEESEIGGCSIDGFRYAGILAASLKKSRIHHNVVRDAYAHAQGVVNTYGITTTDLANTVAARSDSVTVDNNQVYNVPQWAGFDSHGGIRQIYSNNVAYNCLQGIALVLGNESRLSAPQDNIVVGNIVDGNGLAGSTGIRFFGKDATMKGTGVFSANIIRNTDTPWDIDPNAGTELDLTNSKFSGNMPASPYDV